MAASLRAASSSLANRTVHVKTFPSARTLAESREVLRVLEKFGEVTMFRSLKVCYCTLMLIFGGI